MLLTIIPVTGSYGFPTIIRQEIAEEMVPTPDIQGGSSDVFGDSSKSVTLTATLMEACIVLWYKLGTIIP